MWGVQFLTRPFVVGDRIELKTTGGGSILTGVVERIDPMRTMIRMDDSVPVNIPNKAITEMMVSNESRLGTSTVVSGFQVCAWRRCPVCTRVVEGTCAYACACACVRVCVCAITTSTALMCPPWGAA